MPVTQVPTLRWLSGLLQSAAAGPPLHWDMSTSPLAWNVRLCLSDRFLPHPQHAALSMGRRDIYKFISAPTRKVAMGGRPITFW